MKNSYYTLLIALGLTAFNSAHATEFEDIIENWKVKKMLPGTDAIYVKKAYDFIQNAKSFPPEQKHNLRTAMMNINNVLSDNKRLGFADFSAKMHANRNTLCSIAKSDLQEQCAELFKATFRPNVSYIAENWEEKNKDERGSYVQESIKNLKDGKPMPTNWKPELKKYEWDASLNSAYDFIKQGDFTSVEQLKKHMLSVCKSTSTESCEQQLVQHKEKFCKPAPLTKQGLCEDAFDQAFSGSELPREGKRSSSIEKVRDSLSSLGDKFKFW